MDATTALPRTAQPMSIQAPPAVVMVRPRHFRPNPETAADNGFQRSPDRPADEVAQRAFDEVSRAADTLRSAGVAVHLFDDDGRDQTPDSVFPNNWFSTHPGGHVAVYPMFNPSRRRERRSDVLEFLKQHYRVQDVIDYSGLEHDGLFLEGTGAMVLDHLARIAFTARSHRADPVALEHFATHFNYEPLVFDTADTQGRPIYHTNVLMCIATQFALVALDAITDRARAQELRQRLEETGREVLPITQQQVADFAGNAIELSTPNGRVLALSARAAACLTDHQRRAIEQSARLLPLDVPTIELAGGSVRCMLAGVHLAPRRAA
ncbi:citrulline utilization hydrolase CtlX [Hydrogenophaga sp. MI9]|uniref:citrulline utilization hydrolase CtlX n=1 Tax=Hydrogenophaga sp. MI9 TaxID=3453719 RepID=UPI003EF06C12